MKRDFLRAATYIMKYGHKATDRYVQYLDRDGENCIANDYVLYKNGYTYCLRFLDEREKAKAKMDSEFNVYFYCFRMFIAKGNGGLAEIIDNGEWRASVEPSPEVLKIVKSMYHNRLIKVIRH